MAVDKRRQRGQEPVGHGLAVYAAHYLGHGQPALGNEAVAQPCAQAALEHGVDEIAAQHRPAALVAEDVAQRRRVELYGRAVVQARVRPRAQYAGYALLRAAYGPGRPEQIAVRLYGRGMRESPAEGLNHHRGHLMAAPAAIEEHGPRLVVAQLRQQLTVDNAIYHASVLMERVYALRGRAPHHVAAIGKPPVGLCASAVCYKYHIQQYLFDRKSKNKSPENGNASPEKRLFSQPARPTAPPLPTATPPPTAKNCRHNTSFKRL